MTVVPRDHPTYRRLADLVCAAPEAPRVVVRAPFDGMPVGDLPVSTPADVRDAVARARRAQPSWAARTPAERAAVVARFHALVLKRQASLLDTVQLESGKSRVAAFEEVADVALAASYYARTAARHLRSRRRRGAVPGLTRTVEHHHPKGVVGVIAPWNYPLTLAASDAVPALLAGNGVVLKPDLQTPFSALAVLELFREAGLPADLMQVVVGPGHELGPAVVDEVDYVMFTGSTATGRAVAARCGERLIGCSTELGGKNPLLVLGDADVERAARGATNASFANAGQLCVSIERIYVHEAVYDRFLSAFVEQVRRMRLGAGLDWEIDMGSLTTEAQLAAVTAHVDDAVAKGARVLTGGRGRPDLGPFFYEPTVLTDVHHDMLLAAEETFGPVVSLYRVPDDAEAIARANATTYGLNASVWTARRADLAPSVRAGTVNVNEGYSATWASHDAPMGGRGASGLGRRHGREGILKYTDSQTVAVQRLLPIAPPSRLPHRAYAVLMTGAVRVRDKLP